jgi:hypothetical protein
LRTTTRALQADEQYTISGLKSGIYSLIGILGNYANSFGSLVLLINSPQELVFIVEDIFRENVSPQVK